MTHFGTDSDVRFLKFGMCTDPQQLTLPNFNTNNRKRISSRVSTREDKKYVQFLKFVIYVSLAAMLIVTLIRTNMSKIFIQ